MPSVFNYALAFFTLLVTSAVAWAAPCPPGLIAEGVSLAPPSAGCEEESGGWFRNQPVMTWSAPVVNEFGDVLDPNHTRNNGAGSGGRKLLTAWNGMGYDEQNGVMFMLANGGHNDYYGNEVYAADLDTGTPRWRRLSDATLAHGFEGTVRKWSDGRPTAHHSANNTVAGEGRWFVLGPWAPNFNGNAGFASQYWEFDHTGRDPRRITSEPGVPDYIDHGNDHPSGPNNGQLALYDKQDREFIKVLVNNAKPSVVFQSIDNMSGQAVATNGNALSVSGAISGAIDQENRMLVVNAKSSDRLATLSIDGTSAKRNGQWQFVPSEGTKPPSSLWAFHWWSKANGSKGGFITWGGGNDILIGTPSVTGSRYTKVTWRRVQTKGSMRPIDAAGNKRLYNKIQFTEDLAGGGPALIVVGNWNSPTTHVLRLPQAGF